MVMKHHILNANDKTSIGIAFGVTQVKVKVTVAKNRKMVSVQKLEFGMRYGHET